MMSVSRRATNLRTQHVPQHDEIEEKAAPRWTQATATHLFVASGFGPERRSERHSGRLIGDAILLEGVKCADSCDVSIGEGCQAKKRRERICEQGKSAK